MSSTNSRRPEPEAKHGGSRAPQRRIRIVAHRRSVIDHYKLARALLRLAQNEYDDANPRQRDDAELSTPDAGSPPGKEEESP